MSLIIHHLWGFMIQLPNDFVYFPALEGLLHEQQPWPWWRLVQQHFLQAAFFKSSFRVFSYSKIMANLFSYSTHVFFTYCLCFETFSASTLYCEAMHTKHHEVSVDIRLDCWISLAALLSWLISHWDIFYWHRASVLFKKHYKSGNIILWSVVDFKLKPFTVHTLMFLMRL